MDFTIGNINTLFGSDIPMRNILLPLGISFFTFQQIGYLVDIYRRDEVKPAFVDYALFVSFFPQLVAGPIVSGREMMPQFATIAGRRPDPERIGRGLTLFVLGLAKKVLIADAFGRAVDSGYSQIGTIGGLDSFLVMIWYTLQLYYDFSGYCDMAMGLAGMLGFDLPLNFDSPYKAHNIVDFWRRWHMTLTRFFTRYVYIPLGGSRVSKARTIVNILIVYFLSGLWHGAGWNFVLWGMLHGIAYAVVRIGAWHHYKNVTESRNNSVMVPGTNAGTNAATATAAADAATATGSKPLRILSHIATFLYVSFAWVFFRAASITEAMSLIKNMFTGTWNSVNYALADAFVQIDELWYVVKFSGLPGVNFTLAHNLVMIVFTLAVLVMTFAAPNAYTVSKKLRPRAITAVLIGALGLWCVLSLSEVSTFLYFNF
ncbi:MAG: MBOAT family protein [Lachnospiraceae bacterium]|nr:MBOAT family protein [Lachnospiraceae bacterium]